jgi:hypothetical protein
MKTCKVSGFAPYAFSILLSILSVAIFSVSLSGCGSNMSMGGTTPAKTTQVVVLLTSTANDRLSKFTTNLTSIALTNSAGMSTTVFTGANPQNGALVEWMHLNGAAEPLPAVAVPQGTYTSAIVTISNCTFSNVTFANQSLTTEEFSGGPCGQAMGSTTVNLPSPIMVTGTAMALSLDLQVPQSFTLVGSGATAVVTVSPVFNLTPVAIAATPTNETNGKVIGVAAQVMSLNMNGNSFTALIPDGVSLTLSTNSSTSFQGIAEFSSLSANLLVSFDASIQSDGSLLATRVEVDDPTATLEAVGPFLNPAGSSGGFATALLEFNGCASGSNPICGTAGPALFQSSGSTVFNIGQQFSNLASLPFPATFSGANFLQGQNISAFTSSAPQNSPPPIPNASTITLRPQTVNGMVTAISSQSAFTTYTVTLASYDLFPVLQQDAASDPTVPHITAPTVIVVYADTSALFLNSGGMVNVGSLLRFKGLIFDDNGTVRMDASEIYDGVTE